MTRRLFTAGDGEEDRFRSRLPLTWSWNLIGTNPTFTLTVDLKASEIFQLPPGRYEESVFREWNTVVIFVGQSRGSFSLIGDSSSASRKEPRKPSVSSPIEETSPRRVIENPINSRLHRRDVKRDEIRKRRSGCSARTRAIERIKDAVANLALQCTCSLVANSYYYYHRLAIVIIIGHLSLSFHSRSKRIAHSLALVHDSSRYENLNAGYCQILERIRSILM